MNTILSTDSYCAVTAEVNSHGMSKALTSENIKGYLFYKPGEGGSQQECFPWKKAEIGFCCLWHKHTDCTREKKKKNFCQVLKKKKSI